MPLGSALRLAGQRRPTALIVSKEESLGQLTRELLGSSEFGFRCQRFLVHSQESRREILQELAKLRFDLVIAQQRMSPYSALELLRDLREIRRQDGVAVVCLAEHDEGQNEFKSEGGADFVVLEPTAESRRRRVARCIRQLRSFHRQQTLSKTRVLARISQYSREKEFREFAIDIFQELGYRGVRLTHGPNEMGCDIVCWDVNRLTLAEYIGIQVKLRDVSGSAGRNGITTLWNQAVEALSRKVPFPHGRRQLDTFIVMTSGLINEPARTKLSAFLRERGFRNRIFFLDREEIADLMLSSTQALLSRREWAVAPKPTLLDG